MLALVESSGDPMIQAILATVFRNPIAEWLVRSAMGHCARELSRGYLPFEIDQLGLVSSGAFDWRDSAS
ncbi:MAG: hypothetical protein AAFR46_03620 [Pseudomonadota bacterium]